MRNRKSLLSICLFALVLILGVGYAVVNHVDATITGKAIAKTEGVKVAFSSVKEVSDDSKVTANTTSGTLSATINVNELALNETVSATYTILNSETDVDAQVVQHEITNSNSEFFEVTTDIETAKTVSKGGTIDVVVSVKLIKTPVTEEDNETNIGVTLRATPVDNSNTGE